MITDKIDTYLNEMDLHSKWNGEGYPDGYKEQYNLKCCFNCVFVKLAAAGYRNMTNAQGLICNHPDVDSKNVFIEANGICPLFKN